MVSENDKFRFMTFGPRVKVVCDGKLQGSELIDAKNGVAYTFSALSVNINQNEVSIDVRLPQSTKPNLEIEGEVDFIHCYFAWIKATMDNVPRETPIFAVHQDGHVSVRELSVMTNMAFEEIVYWALIPKPKPIDVIMDVESISEN